MSAREWLNRHPEVDAVVEQTVAAARLQTEVDGETAVAMLAAKLRRKFGAKVAAYAEEFFIA